nr:reverse transcriptase domain-containing protein [Tanacetum cinerariifolium]
MAIPLPNHVVNLLDDEQVQLEPVLALLRFALAVLEIPNNNNGWIEEEQEEYPEIEEEEEEEEEEEMDIKEEMNDPEIINPYEIKEGELPPPPTDSNTSSDSEPEVEAEDENENEAATVGTITRVPYHVKPFLGTTYVGSRSSSKVFAPVPIGKDVDILHRKVKSLAQQMFKRANTKYSTLKRLGEMVRYLGGISMERRSETREHHELNQSVSTLEDQMQGLMLEDKEEKKRLKKKLRVSQQEKEKMEQAFHHVVDWIRKWFGVKIPPCMGDGDATTPDNAHPQEESMLRWKQNELVERMQREGSNANETGGQDRAPLGLLSFVDGLRSLRWFLALVTVLKETRKSWGDTKKMMMEEFYPNEEVQMMENELRSLKLRDTNIAACTQRSNELVLLCPKAVPSKKKKVEAYIKGLPENIKGEVTSSRPVNLNETVRMAHTLMEKKIQAKAKRIAEGNKRKWENSQAEQSGYKGNKPLCNSCKKHHTGNCVLTCHNCGRPGHYARDSRKKAVATGANTQLTLVCYGCGERGHTRNYCPKKNNQQGHLFKIDLMPIELGTFDVIISMDWLVEQDAIIVYGKKVVHVPYKNKTLVVEGDRGASRLKVISCIKAIKFIERGSQLFVAHVAEKEPQEKLLEDVPVIRDFPEVFPDDLPGLPPPRQVEFRIDLVPGAAPVAHAPYRLALSEMKELVKQLQELSEKGFIRPSSSP